MHKHLPDLLNLREIKNLLLFLNYKKSMYSENLFNAKFYEKCFLFKDKQRKR